MSVPSRNVVKNDMHLRLLYAIDVLNAGVRVDDISGVLLLRTTISPIILSSESGARCRQVKRNPPSLSIDYKTEEGFKLGDWISNQREKYQKGKIEATRKARLDSIGMIWEKQTRGKYVLRWRKTILKSTEICKSRLSIKSTVFG